MKKMSKRQQVFLIISVFATVMLLFFVGRVVGRLIILAAAISGLIYFIVQFIQLSTNKNSVSKPSDQEANINEKQTYCYEQIEINEEELLKIEAEIRELRQDLESYYKLNPENKAETEKLIAAFKKQKELRELKISFFRDCLKKLGTIRHNHMITQRLLDKKESLRKLREKNLDDVADFESFKTELVYEEEYLKTIDQLSRRMFKIDTIPDAENVQKELELITQELRRL